MRNRLVCLATLLMLAGAAAADPVPELGEASLAFERGAFDRAASLGVERGDADGLALAARALLAEAVTGETDPPPALIAEAERLADLALAQDPHHIEARLQLAIAWSLRLRAMSNGEARRSGLGGDTRALVRSVLEDDPGNPYAHGLMAVWHIEVVRRGGSLGAAIMGASIDDALAHHRLAAEGAPHEAALHWQVARALTALDARRYRNEIDAALALARTGDPHNPLQPVISLRAEHLAEAIETRPAREVETLAAQML